MGRSKHSEFGSPKHDLTGKKFGYWEIISFSHRKHRPKIEGKRQSGPIIFYNCKCICGTESIVSRQMLRDGYSKSCGCSKKDWSSRKKHSHLQEGESGFNTYYKQYKLNAKKRELEFNITKDDAKILSKSNCFYCGEIPLNRINPGGLSGNRYGSYISNGIDRKDSSIGYNLENCVACCGSCNISKRDIPFDVFVDKIEKIYNNLIRNKIINDKEKI